MVIRIPFFANDFKKKLSVLSGGHKKVHLTEEANSNCVPDQHLSTKFYLPNARQNEAKNTKDTRAKYSCCTVFIGRTGAR